MNLLRLLACVLLLLVSRSASGQAPSGSGSSPADAAVAVLTQYYNDSFAGHPQLYNGPEYLDYSKRYSKSTGHQFFLSPEKQIGSVYYNDHYFTHVALSYDIVLDQLVLQHATSPFTLRLINENVRYFLVANHHFIRIVADSAASRVLRTGFYELLLDGPVQLLAQRTKVKQETIAQSKINVAFLPMDKFFVRKEGRYYPVKNKSALTRLFVARSKEIHTYIRDNKLRFGKESREQDMLQLTRYYSSLPAQ